MLKTIPVVKRKFRNGTTECSAKLFPHTIEVYTELGYQYYYFDTAKAALNWLKSNGYEEVANGY